MDNLFDKVRAVNSFWFEELTEKEWWVKSDKLGQEIKKRFGELHQMASNGELSTVRSTAEEKEFLSRPNSSF